MEKRRFFENGHFDPKNGLLSPYCSRPKMFFSSIEAKSRLTKDPLDRFGSLYQMLDAHRIAYHRRHGKDFFPYNSDFDHFFCQKRKILKFDLEILSKIDQKKNTFFSIG